MLTATKAKNERQWKKSEQNKYDISSIKRVTRKFLEVSRCISLPSRAKQRQRNVKKRVVHGSLGRERSGYETTCKVVFLPIDLLLFFHRSRSLIRLALHDFIFCLSKLYILSRASLLALAKYQIRLDCERKTSARYDRFFLKQIFLILDGLCNRYF